MLHRDLGQDQKPDHEGLRGLPLLAGPFAPLVFAGNMTANLRNMWSFMHHLCGHFPEGVQTTVRGDQAETGQWYFRQILGSANLTGGKWFHILTGNLSTRSSTTCSRTSPRTGTPRSPREVKEICELRHPGTTRARCPNSSPAWCAKVFPPRTAFDTPNVRLGADTPCRRRDGRWAWLGQSVDAAQHRRLLALWRCWRSTVAK